MGSRHWHLSPDLKTGDFVRLGFACVLLELAQAANDASHTEGAAKIFKE